MGKVVVIAIVDEDPKKRPEGEELEAVVDEDVERFNEWFQGLGNGPLVKSERAIVKTYLAYKTKPEKEDGAEESH
jgi:hypothetical protein